MKTRMNKALPAALLCLFLAGTQAVHAQDYKPVPVTVSHSTVNMDGKTYYAHIVLERQTIYSITKVYGVTEEDLYAANPKLKTEGLKSGTVIYIPADKKAATATRTPATQTETAPATQTAKPGKQDAFPDKPGFIKHTVRWFEDIYDVAKTYGVTVQDIMNANGLKSSSISKRQVLYIPVLSDEEKARRAATKDNTVTPPPTVPEKNKADVPETKTETKAETKTETKTETVVTQPGQTQQQPKEEEEDENILDWLTGKGSVEMALILPFNAAGKVSETNMDFYSGVLLALRDLEAEGIKLKLNVHDLQAGLPSESDLGKNDFILGPVTSADLTSVMDRVGGKVPVISPLDQRAASLAERGHFIQVPSSAASQYADLAAWAAGDAGRSDRIILISEKNNDATSPAPRIRETLQGKGVAFDDAAYTQSELRSLPASLTSRLVKGGTNRIIAASEKEAFVGNLVRDLDLLRTRGYTIVMYAPSKVRTFDSVESSSIHQNALHISSPYFVDYAKPETRAFIRAYRALFKTEPSQFAFQGYDTARFFAGLVGKYGRRWTSALTKVDGTGLHTDFHFVKTPSGSFRNTAIRHIVYRTDYSTELDR